MAVPAPRTWAPGEIPTAAHFNADIRDAVNFYKRPPAGQAKDASDDTITAETWTLVSWTDTDPFDTDTVHSTSSNTSRLVATTAGFYQAYAHLRWAEHIDNIGIRSAQIRKNAAGASGGGSQVALDIRHSNNFSSDRMGQSFTGFCQMAATDYLEVFVWHDQTNAIGTPISTILYHGDTVAATRFGMVWIAS